MGLAHSPRIITNGLIGYWDAGNSKSYNNTSLWYDLTANKYTATFSIAATFDSAVGGSVVFNGTSQSAFTSLSSGTISGGTFISWIKRNGAQPNYTGIFYGRGTTANGLGFFGTSNTICYTWNGSVSTYTWNSGLLIPDGAWCMCVVSVSLTSAIAYLYQASGLTSATNSVSHSSTTVENLIIGRDSVDNARYFKGNISNTQFYNRALLAEEINQNYNALRGRFGL